MNYLKKERKDIKIDLETHEKIKYLSDASNMPISKFLKELIDQIFQVGASFEKANISYVHSILRSSVELRFDGKSRLKIGSIPLKDGEKEPDLEKVLKEP